VRQSWELKTLTCVVEKKQTLTRRKKSGVERPRIMPRKGGTKKGKVDSGTDEKDGYLNWKRSWDEVSKAIHISRSPKRKSYAVVAKKERQDNMERPGGKEASRSTPTELVCARQNKGVWGKRRREAGGKGRRERLVRTAVIEKRKKKKKTGKRKMGAQGGSERWRRRRSAYFGTELIA